MVNDLLVSGYGKNLMGRLESEGLGQRPDIKECHSILYDLILQYVRENGPTFSYEVMRFIDGKFRQSTTSVNQHVLHSVPNKGKELRITTLEEAIGLVHGKFDELRRNGPEYSIQQRNYIFYETEDSLKKFIADRTKKKRISLIQIVWEEPKQ